jgi:hypothetical protein
MWEGGGQLVTLWGSDDRDRDRGFTVNVVLQDSDGLLLLEHSLPSSESTYPDLSVVFPAANRMQRATFDLVGIASEAEDQRPWLWQASWPIDQYPLRRDFIASEKWQPGEEGYAFVRVEGDGVHEIPVGPVHAGIIEPGHFRFQVVGEKVLRLEERLGYVHKGIEKRFEAMTAAAGYRLAGRVSGDSTVAYAWAYAQALEALSGAEPPARASWLRALALERERIANHLGDLGYLGNDGGFAFGLAQFSRLKEHVLRTNLIAFGHRLAMDFIVPGGVAHDVAPAGAAAMADECAMLEREIATLRDIYDEHDGLQDRFRTCGIATTGARREARTDRPRGTRERAGARRALRLSVSTLRRSRRTPRIGGRGRCRGARGRSLRRAHRIAAASALDTRRAAGRRYRHGAPRAARVPQGNRLCRRLARSGARRARMRAGRDDTPLPSARSVVVELAGARACGHRQYRSRLPADQQVVQPELQRS